MTEGNLARDPEERAGPLFAGLAGRLEGDPDHQPPLILPHEPQATITVWPASTHFPHLAHPRRFAECLAATARWSTLPRQPAHNGPRTTYSEPAP